MQPLLELNEELLSETFKERIDLLLRTSGSVVLLFADRVLKLRPDTQEQDNRQAAKATKMLETQGVLREQGRISINGLPLRFITLKRFPSSSCYASKLTSGETPNIETLFSTIRQLEKCYASDKVPIMKFELGVAKNISIQLKWARQNLPKELFDKTNEVLNAQWSLARLFYGQAKEVDCYICHGDMHAGNVYYVNDHVFVLDPTESDVAFSRVPLWADYASLAASLLLLNRKDLYDRVVLYLEENYGDYNDAFFRIWLIVKLIVRLRFERRFLELNRDHVDHIICDWRRKLLADGFDALELFLRATEARTGPLRFLKPNPTRLETLKLVNQTIEGRRDELNSKTNIYVAVTIALIAGNVAFLAKITASISIGNVVLLLSIAIAVVALWYFLGLIKGFSIDGTKPNCRSKVLFFGWLANTRLAHVIEEFANISEVQLSNELLVQVRSLSYNLRYRYNVQSKANKLLVIAMALFVYGVIEQTLGISGYIVQAMSMVHNYFVDAISNLMGVFL